MFDAVPVAPDADLFSQEVVTGPSADSSADTSGTASTSDEGQRASEVVFVDKSVEDYQQLLAEFVDGRDVEVFFINDGSPGLEQIADHLEGWSDIDAIHIISHGDDAQLRLGNSVIGTDDLSNQHSDALGRIGAALSETGDVLIYGCDLASTDEGLSLIHI